MYEAVWFWIWFVSVIFAPLYVVFHLIKGKPILTYRDLLWFIFGGWSMGFPFIMMVLIKH